LESGEWPGSVTLLCRRATGGDVGACAMGERKRVLFQYLGRRGAITRMVLELAQTLRDAPHIVASFVLSEDVEGSDAIRGTGADITYVPTFSDAVGAVAGAFALRSLRAKLRATLEAQRPDAVIELMTHVWSPFLEAEFRRARVRRIAVVHDASPHPGDPFGLATGWLLASALRADRIVALSNHVAGQILAKNASVRQQLGVLFHPVFNYAQRKQPRAPGAPLRVLFLGRILPYKGLDLLVAALEELRARGLATAPTILGDGSLGVLKPRLEALGARVVNRWLEDVDIAEALADSDILVAPYREASQSGVAAAALGAGVPVVVTPAGGLPEQILPGVDGEVAAGVTASAIADALAPFAADPSRVEPYSRRIIELAPSRSMDVFVNRLLEMVGE